MSTLEVRVPDIGDFDEVDVVEVLVQAGSQVEREDSLITLESDKASLDVPSPESGTVREVRVEVGGKVSEGDVILVLEVSEGADVETAQEPAEKAADEEEGQAASEARIEAEPASKSEDSPPESEEEPPASPKAAPPPPSGPVKSFAGLHASPGVRRFARELGVDLRQVKGTGARGRILKEDVQRYVKGELAAPRREGGLGLPEMPRIDFTKFGEIERRPLTRIQKISGPNLQRSWLHAPHVTQFDEADITEMDQWRRERAPEAEKKGFKLTPLAFIMKAAVAALEEFPTVNSSLDPDGEGLILKKYFHIGIAVDTDGGLVVPVIRDVDCKGIFDLAEELGEVSARAREGKLKLSEVQGASFTISSLGGIGGTAFTPIVNTPEVAILGVARAGMKPVWDKDTGEFVPRLVLPFSLSYDHRVVDGALGVRFTTFFAGVLGDIRRLAL